VSRNIDVIETTDIAGNWQNVSNNRHIYTQLTSSGPAFTSGKVLSSGISSCLMHIFLSIWIYLCSYTLITVAIFFASLC